MIKRRGRKNKSKEIHTGAKALNMKETEMKTSSTNKRQRKGGKWVNRREKQNEGES